MAAQLIVTHSLPATTAAPSPLLTLPNPTCAHISLSPEANPTLHAEHVMYDPVQGMPEAATLAPVRRYPEGPLAESLTEHLVDIEAATEASVSQTLADFYTFAPGLWEANVNDGSRPPHPAILGALLECILQGRVVEQTHSRGPVTTSRTCLQAMDEPPAPRRQRAQRRKLTSKDSPPRPQSQGRPRRAAQNPLPWYHPQRLRHDPQSKQLAPPPGFKSRGGSQ